MSRPANVEDVRAEYEVGYKADVECVSIEGDVVALCDKGKPFAGHYTYDGKKSRPVRRTLRAFALFSGG